jgi:membrane-associated protein
VSNVAAPEPCRAQPTGLLALAARTFAHAAGPCALAVVPLAEPMAPAARPFAPIAPPAEPFTGSPARPWRPRAGWTPLTRWRAAGARGRVIDAVCAGGLLAQTVWGVAATLLIPSLVGTHPVLLEAFTASTPAMVAAGAFVRVGRAVWYAALAAPVIGWVPLDVLGWWAGRRFGRAAVDVVTRGRPRTTEVAERADGLTRRHGRWALVLVLWLPIPNQLVYAATGWARMRLSTFLVWDVVGSLARAAAIVALGYGLGDDAVAVAATISHYALAGVAVLLAGAGAWWVWALRHARSRTR